MGRKLDLSGLTDQEAEHVLKVVQRDMRLRKTEEERLSEMRQELAEEGSRCSLLSRQHLFNQHCCIRCCVPFTFLLNPRRRCLDCQYNVCKGCRTYCQRDAAWLCSACQKGRVLRTQSLEWYYNNVKRRFKRFGSAKVLKTLYRKHIDERGALSLSDLPDGSVQEGSNDNDDSVCGSDSAFYKQSEGHSMADTLTVALRVAEEAIEEAISKAEEFSDSLEKQNEARYLRDHREDLIEELATTIVQKIIQRRKHSVMQSEYDFVWPQTATPLAPPSQLASPAPPPGSSQGLQDPLPTAYSLWRSRSAFSLTSDDSPEKGPEDPATGAMATQGYPEYASLKREAKATALPSWKSVDRLDNSSASSVLQSPDGNWMALQSSQLSRPSLLTKRKSLVFSVLEKESGVVSAYDEMRSESGGVAGGVTAGGDHNDNNGEEDDDDEGGWGAALLQFRRKLSDDTYDTDSQHDPEWTFTRHPAQPPPPPASPPADASSPPPPGRHVGAEPLSSDAEASGPARPFAPPPSCSPQHRRPHPLKKRGPPPPDPHPHQLPPEALDVNFNPKVTGDSSEAEERPVDPVRRSRRRRKSKKDSSSSTEQSRPAVTHSIHPLIRENSGILLSAMLKRSLSQDQPGPGAPPSPLSTSMPGTQAAPEDVFFNSDPTSPDATETDLDTLAPPLTPSSPERCSSPDGPLGEGPMARPLGEGLMGGPLRLGPMAGPLGDGPTGGPLGEGLTAGPLGLGPTAAPLGEGPMVWGAPQPDARMSSLMSPLSSSGDERVRRPPGHTTDGDSGARGDREGEGEEEEEEDRQEHGTEEKRLRQTPSDEEGGGQTAGALHGAERDRQAGPAAGEETREDGGARRENGQRPHPRHHDDKRGKRAVKREVRRPGQRQTTRRSEEQQEEAPGFSGSSASGSPAVTPVAQEEELSDGQEDGQRESELQQRLNSLSQQQQKFSAASLCSITTEVLKVLNATEDLIGEAGRADSFTTPSESMSASPISSCSDTSRLDHRLTKMEENVYLAASAVYGLEGALGDLEECARSISGGTTDTELAFLEEQVATAAAQVQQSEMQISNIEARISALKTAGLNVTACNRFSKYKPKPQTLDSSRHQRRKLPAPPLKEKLDQEQQTLRP